MKPSPRNGSVPAWFDERLGLSQTLATLRKHRVASGRLDYAFAVAALGLMVAQVLSGVLLMMHYRPNAPDARQSVLHISSQVPFGSLVRGVHLWASDLLIFALLGYLFSMLVMRTYRRPRELLWTAGVIVMFLAIALAYTGSMLPWSSASLTQAQVGAALSRRVPLIGEWLSRFMLGGETTTGETLLRAYGFHVAVLPATMTFVVMLHRILLSGYAAGRPRPSDDASIPLYPHFIARAAWLWTLLLLMVVSLAIFVPRPTGDPLVLANAAAQGVRPAWYLLALHDLLRIAPSTMLGIEGARFVVGATTAALIAVLLLPLIDRRGSRVTIYLAWAMLAVVVLLTGHAFL